MRGGTQGGKNSRKRNGEERSEDRMEWWRSGGEEKRGGEGGLEAGRG